MSDLREHFPELWEALQEKMREGPPPEDPGREGVGKSLFNQASSKTKAQGNKKYVAEERHSSYRSAIKFLEEARVPADEFIGFAGLEAIKPGKILHVNDNMGKNTFSMSAMKFLNPGDKLKVIGAPKKYQKRWQIPAKPVKGGDKLWIDARDVDVQMKLWDK